MKAVMAALTAVTLTALIATPAIAQDRDAATAACKTYAELKTEPMPSASPRLDAPPPPAPATPGVTRPPSGGIQAPGAGAGSASRTDLSGKSAEFQQAFGDCMTKLGG